jgi:poly(3-hydroxybutyrate) depolymerase
MAQLVYKERLMTHRQTYKFYLPDIIKINYSDMANSLNSMNPSKVYFWFNETDLTQKEVKNFTDSWQELNHTNYTTTIRTYFFANTNDYTTWDFIPYTQLYNYDGINHTMYWRYQWQYTTPNQIMDGLSEAKKIWDLINREEPPQRTQKRNDGEDSNYR